MLSSIVVLGLDDVPRVSPSGQYWLFRFHTGLFVGGRGRGGGGERSIIGNTVQSTLPPGESGCMLAPLGILGKCRPSEVASGAPEDS